ncbi:MAG TPA: diguanylate cyclase [Candidatus Nitrosotenuis sp.]|nr:diguanylate cyclase [Candidatus Nitrosotenuis sp.]
MLVLLPLATVVALLALSAAFDQGLSRTFAVLLGGALVYELLSPGVPVLGAAKLGFVVCFAAAARPAELYGGQFPAGPQLSVKALVAEPVLLALAASLGRALVMLRRPALERVAEFCLTLLRVALVSGLFLFLVPRLNDGKLALESVATMSTLIACGLVLWVFDLAVAGRGVLMLGGPEAHDLWKRIFERTGLLGSMAPVGLGYLAVVMAAAWAPGGLQPALLGALGLTLVPALVLRAFVLGSVELVQLTEEARRKELASQRASREQMASMQQLLDEQSQTLQKKLDDLSMLYEMARQLGGATRLKDTLDIVQDTLARIDIPFQSCVLFLKGEKGPIPVRAISPYQRLLNTPGLEIHDPLIVGVFSSTGPRLAQEESPTGKGRLFQQELSRLCVPMRVAGKVEGAIYLGALEPGTLTEEHLHTLAHLATHAGPSIRMAQLLEEKERDLELERTLRGILQAQNRKLEGLKRIAERIGRNPSLENCAITLAEELATMLPQARSVVVFFTEGADGLDLVPVYAHTPYADFVGKLMVRGDDGLMGEAIGRRQCLIVPDTAGCPHPNLLAYERSVILAPLVYEAESMGCLYLGAAEAGTFTELDRDLMETIAYQAALAVKNARSFERSQEMARTDGLTGLATHREFKARLEEEMVSARKRSRPLSLIMVDTDHFKTYNDTLGHPAGDRLLKDIAALLRESVRASDIVCRYGGDEFALILKECPKDRAVETAHRIREAFQLRFASHPVQVTSSIGVANFPLDAQTLKELTQAADDALYCSKRGGRNRVSVAPPQASEVSGVGREP